MIHESKRSLKEELAAHSGKVVLLGARSSFFFIGPAEEAMADWHLLSQMVKLCGPLAAHKDVTGLLPVDMDDVGERRVVKSYVRDEDYCKDQVVIIVEGRELGAFWSREEYLAGKDALLAAMAAKNITEPCA